MKTGDLVKYKQCGTFGVITKVYEGQFNKSPRTICTVLLADGKTKDVMPRRLEVIRCNWVI